MGNLYLDGVFRVVEVNDINVKDEDGRAGNEIVCIVKEKETLKTFYMHTPISRDQSTCIMFKAVFFFLEK